MPWRQEDTRTCIQKQQELKELLAVFAQTLQVENRTHGPLRQTSEGCHTLQFTAPLNHAQGCVIAGKGTARALEEGPKMEARPSLLAGQER